jgi:hypothetical protein
MALYYLSFCGEEGWRGGTVVEAEDFIMAVVKTHRLGINPGGEVHGAALQEDAMNDPEALRNVAAMLNRLMTQEQMTEALGTDEMVSWPEGGR